MKFVFPAMPYERQATEYIQEFLAYDSPINGTGGLDRFLQEASYAEWTGKVLKDVDIANIPAGRVPALTYFCVREEDDQIVGMVNIRLALTDFLRREGGHIGYSVRPTERRKGYGSAILREAVRVCATLGITRVLVSCDRANIASSGVIRSCGGVLEAEFYSDTFQEIVQRYVINTTIGK